jgi:hypothetical protein
MGVRMTGSTRRMRCGGKIEGGRVGSKGGREGGRAHLSHDFGNSTRANETNRGVLGRRPEIFHSNTTSGARAEVSHEAVLLEDT